MRATRVQRSSTLTSHVAAPFGKLLRQHRLTAGLSQEELAERAGLSVRGISDLERGRRATPRPETVRMLAEALKLDGTARDGLIAAARPELAATAGPLLVASPDRTFPRPSLLALARLPIPPTRLVGREQDVASVFDLLLRPEVRLVTLTGAGGTGKTRLAIAVAEEMAAGYADGAAFVDLAPVRDPEVVPAAIARVLGVWEDRGQTLLAALRAFVAERAMLLVLDNCEHLLSGLPVATQLLAASPGSKILATSRERLHLRGERELRIDPLPVPEIYPGSGPDVDMLTALANVPAVRLFVERVVEVKPRFVLTAADASAVAEVCRRLEGVPLALELAAARVRHLPPPALLTRLERQLPELFDGPRDLPARQQTLRAAITWSHDLLTAGEQILFRRLAVFAGGWDLAAADGIGSGPTFGPLTSLVDKSLVRQIDTSGEPRYGILETVREYALERLVASGEEASIRDAHAAFFLALAQEAEERSGGPEELAWKERLEVEHANIRAALGWLLTGGPPEGGLRLAAAMERFWTERGHLAEGRAWLERALARSSDRATYERARALRVAGMIAFHQGDRTEAAAFGEASLAIARQLGDRRAIAGALLLVGMVAWRRGDPGHGVACLDGALAIQRDLGAPNAVARVLVELATAAHAGGDLASPVPLLEEAISFFRRTGYLTGLNTALANLAVVHQIAGDHARAEALMEEGLAIARRLGIKSGVAMHLGNLANLPRVQADPPRAARFYRESLDAFVELGDRAGIAESLDDIAGFAAADGRAAEAAYLLGSTRALRAAIGLPRPEVFRYLTDQAVAAATAALGEAGFAAAYAIGEARPLEDTIAATLSWLTEEQSG